MSKYLGFQPTQRPDYYFISYNSEDNDRVGLLGSQLYHANMPLWYDYGLEYGEKWGSQIADKIKNAQAVILFFTKGILEAAGISSHAEKMNMLIEKYRKLYDNGEKKEAERFLCEYLHGQNLAGKAQLVANLVCGGVVGSVIKSSATQITEIKDQLLKDKLGTYPPFEMEDCFRMTVKEDDFTILIREVSVPPSGAAINAVQVLREYDSIYIATNLRDAANLKIYYDSYDDVIFISVEGESVSKERVAGTYINIITVEKPNSDAVCNIFRDVRLKR